MKIVIIRAILLFRPEQLLGELQMAFLCFLVGQVYTAFEQWKKLVHLFCSADELLLKEPQLFVDFIAVFYFQVFNFSIDFVCHSSPNSTTNRSERSTLLFLFFRCRKYQATSSLTLFLRTTS